jgi:hypothetical protein
MWSLLLARWYRVREEAGEISRARHRVAGFAQLKDATGGRTGYGKRNSRDRISIRDARNRMDVEEGEL